MRLEVEMELVYVESLVFEFNPPHSPAAQLEAAHE